MDVVDVSGERGGLAGKRPLDNGDVGVDGGERFSKEGVLVWRGVGGMGRVRVRSGIHRLGVVGDKCQEGIVDSSGAKAGVGPWAAVAPSAGALGPGQGSAA